MRLVQYRILTRILDKVQVPEYIYAFEKSKSIPVMAQLHVGKNLLISVDIKNFFHSIKQRVVIQILQEGLGIGSQPARLISELCTYEAFTPQGALTSPKISNLVAALTFGPLIKAWADSNDFTCTIYADDVTLSTDRSDVVVPDVVRFLQETIRQFNFRLNHKKTKIMHRGCRQFVCGVVVNQKTNMVRKQRDNLKAMVHNVCRNGYEVEARRLNKTPSEFENHLKGRLNWFSQLNLAAADKLRFRLASLV